MKTLPTLPGDLNSGVVMSGLPPDTVIAWCHQGLVPYGKLMQNQLALDLVTLAMRTTVVMGKHLLPGDIPGIKAVPLTPLHLTGALSLIAGYFLKVPENAREFFARYPAADEPAYRTAKRVWTSDPANEEAGRAVIAFHISIEMKRASSLFELYQYLTANHD